MSMSPTPYSEDILVQQTTADYLEQQLGWEPSGTLLLNCFNRTLSE